MSPTDRTLSLLLKRNSHRLHRSAQMVRVCRFSHGIHGSHRITCCEETPTESTDLTELLAVKRLPRNPRNSRKFIAEKKLPQIAQIHTDVTSGGAAVSAAPTKPDGTIILTVGVSQNLTNADSASL